MPSILVVDDETDLLATYDRLLKRAGYRTITAATRQAALTALETGGVDLVIADVRLQDGDGLDVVRVARTCLPPPPVIVVSGFTSRQSRQQAADAGAAAYLPKPFSTAALTSLIRDTLVSAPA